MKSICFTAGAGTAAAAEAKDAERKKPAAEQWRQFMNVVGV